MSSSPPPHLREAIYHDYVVLGHGLMTIYHTLRRAGVEVSVVEVALWLVDMRRKGRKSKTLNSMIEWVDRHQQLVSTIQHHRLAMSTTADCMAAMGLRDWSGKEPNRYRLAKVFDRLGLKRPSKPFASFPETYRVLRSLPHQLLDSLANFESVGFGEKPRTNPL